MCNKNVGHINLTTRNGDFLPMRPKLFIAIKYQEWWMLGGRTKKSTPVSPFAKWRSVTTYLMEEFPSFWLTWIYFSHSTFFGISSEIARFFCALTPTALSPRLLHQFDHLFGIPRFVLQFLCTHTHFMMKSFCPAKKGLFLWTCLQWCIKKLHNSCFRSVSLRGNNMKI